MRQYNQKEAGTSQINKRKGLINEEMNAIETSLRFILKEDELKRINITEDKTGTATVRVDLHEMHVKEARHFLKNIIAVSRKDFLLEVIHGYNNGTALKTMVLNDMENKRIKDRSEVRNNPGRTMLNIAAA